MAAKKRHSVPAWFLAVHWGIAAASSLVTAVAVLSAGAPPVQQSIHNISLTRLLLAAMPLAATGMAVLFMVRAFAKGLEVDPVAKVILAGASRTPLVPRLARVSAVLGLIALCLPDYHFGDFAAYYAGIRPLIVWTGSLGLQMLLLLRYPGRTEARLQLQPWLRQNTPVLKVAAWIVLGMLVVGILLLFALRGVSTYEDYRYETGVPILAVQLMVSALAGKLLQRFLAARTDATLARLDRWMVLVIWLLAAMYWAGTPATYSYMNPAPKPPNNEVYPYSDASQYDLQAQAALLGQGLDNGRSMDNPLYPAFLVLVHLVSGQDFEANMAVQAAILAALPAIAYLLGKELHGRPLGFAAACMVAFQGANSIAASAVINSASPKQMLTDFPAAIGTALVILTALKILKHQEDLVEPAIWHGASLGFAFLIRPSSAILLAIVPIITLLGRVQFKNWLARCLVIAAGFLLFVAPWAIRNQLINQDAGYAYLSKLNLVVENRFRDLEEKRSDSARPPVAQESPVAPGTEIESPASARIARIGPVVLHHFANNVLTSVMSLPTSAVIQDLQHTLKAPGSAWSTSWSGAMQPAQMVWFILPAAFLAIGGAVLWKISGHGAYVPLLAFLLYQLANAVGRTSGGRYVVPVSWIVLLYFAAGLLAVLNRDGLGASRTDSDRAFVHRQGVRRTLGVFLCAAVLGASPVLVEVAIPARFPQRETASAQAAGKARAVLLDAGYSSDDVDRYLSTRRVVSLLGRAMYPEWFSYRALTRGTEGALAGLRFPHLEFTLIDPQRGQSEVFLFAPDPIELANTSDVLVIGCRQHGTGYIDAVALVETSLVASPSLRATLGDLECPLASPVCDNNGNCS